MMKPSREEFRSRFGVRGEARAWGEAAMVRGCHYSRGRMIVSGFAAGYRLCEWGFVEEGVVRTLP